MARHSSPELCISRVCILLTLCCWIMSDHLPSAILCILNLFIMVLNTFHLQFSSWQFSSTSKHLAITRAIPHLTLSMVSYSDLKV